MSLEDATSAAGVRERLGQALFLRVAGPDGARHASGSTAAPGRGGSSPTARSPGSTATRRCSSAASGPLLLQTLHPAAMTRRRRALRLPRRHVGTAGPHQPLPRGHHVRHRPDDAQQAVDAVRSIHERVDRHACPTGRRTPPPTRTCCAGCTWPRSTASCARTQVYGKRAARPGRPRRVRRPDRRGRPPARRDRPADDRGGAGRRARRRTAPSCAATAEAREAVVVPGLAPAAAAGRPGRRTARWWRPRSG